VVILKIGGVMTQGISVDVVDIRKMTGSGKLKAVADVKFGGVLTAKGFCVFEGKEGPFVSMPSKPSKEGKWFDMLEAESELKNEIQSKVLESYDLELDGVKR
jgi:DNA-binding cell septation regulator SpoVG